MSENSVITKQQLELLIQSMNDSVSKTELNSIFRSFEFQSPQKQEIYHNINQIIKKSSDPAMEIFLYFQDIINEKLNQLKERLENKTEEKKQTGQGLSPIFRRVQR